ncbi:MAG: AsmA-like C-terminal region-containing protein, partial [Cytophagales bacterium]
RRPCSSCPQAGWGRGRRHDFKIFDFEKPFLESKLKTKQYFKDLISFAKIDDLEAFSGTVIIDLNLKTFISDLKTKKLNKKLNFNGELNLDSLSFSHKALKQKIDYFDCNVQFDQNILNSENLVLKIGDTEIKSKLKISNLLPYFMDKTQSLKVDLDLIANKINTNELIAPSPKKNNESEKEELNQPILINLNATIDELVHENYKAKDFSAQISILNKKTIINNLKTKTLGGKVEVPSFVLNQENKNYDRYDLTFSTENIKIDSLMSLFNNFEQDFITNKNLKGDLTLNGQCSFITDKKGEFNPKSLNAQLDFSIINGHLIKFEPMKKLSKFLKHQDLEDIRFHELKNSIHIEDELITIPEMTIRSNLNTITILGTQHFNGSMNYKLALDLKNYKTPQGEDHQFRPDHSGRTQLFLNMQKSANGDLKISYDTKATKEKINESLKREKEEFINIFKKKKEEKKSQKVEISEDELFLDD